MAKILIVDDEEPTRRALVRILAANSHYSVTVASDGVEGLELAKRDPPDLIVSDVTMPGLDGLKMVDAIRDALGRKVPVIFLTAKGGARDVVAGIQAGARHYLVKPIDIVDLEYKVSRILRC